MSLHLHQKQPAWLTGDDEPTQIITISNRLFVSSLIAFAIAFIGFVSLLGYGASVTNMYGIPDFLSNGNSSQTNPNLPSQDEEDKSTPNVNAGGGNNEKTKHGNGYEGFESDLVKPKPAPEPSKQAEVPPVTVGELVVGEDLS